MIAMRLRNGYHTVSQKDCIPFCYFPVNFAWFILCFTSVHINTCQFNYNFKSIAKLSMFSMESAAKKETLSNFDVEWKGAV